MEAVSWVNRGDGLETPGRRMGSDRGGIESVTGRSWMDTSR